MSILAPEPIREPFAVNGIMAAGAVLVLAVMIAAAVYSRPASVNKPAALQPVGTYAVTCWSLTHPEIKDVGKVAGLVANSFVSCVVIDTRTGEVTKEFLPSVPRPR